MKSKKHQLIREIFEGLRKIDSRSDVLPFNNDMVKELSSRVKFRNPFDATKFDTFESMPTCLKQEGFFVVHLGRGNHAFVKGTGYHHFEPIQETKIWNPSKSIVSKLGKSEAGTVSTIYNEKIIHDFLCGNADKEIKIHISRRSNVTYDFWIGNNELHADWLQIEVDAFFEADNIIAAVEVKNIKHTNFEIRQVYSSMRYLDRFYRDGIIPKKYKLRFLFFQKGKKNKMDFYRLYEYRFNDWRKMDSIELIKNAQYNMKEEYSLF